MGEDFANALEEIDEVVQTTSRGLALYPKDLKLQDLVAQLCCRILTFVAVPLKWYSESGGKRLRTSFNENASKVYEKHVEAIRRLAGFIDQTINLCAAEQTQRLHLLMRENNVLSRQNKELQEERLRSKWQINESHYALFQQAADESNRQLREDPHRRLLRMSFFIGEPPSNDLGQPIKQILDWEAMQFIANEHDGRNALSQRERLDNTSFITAAVDDAQLDSKKLLCTRAEVENASGNLNAFFDFDKIAPRAPENVHFAETEVVQRLQDWTTASLSSFLGIFGPFAHFQDNAFRLLTSKSVRAARAADIACVSYFCELPRTSLDPKRLPETVETSAMICALIRQMVLHLPVQLPECSQLDTLRFGVLDGTLQTWDAALSLLSDLIALTEAPVLLFAVYGLEMLEHNTTRKRLEGFVDALGQHVSLSKANGQVQTIFKVLFVTSGTSQVLASKLDNDEICDMNRGDAAIKPGAARRGRTALSDLDFGS